MRPIDRAAALRKDGVLPKCYARRWRTSTESVHFRFPKYRQYQLRFRKSHRVAPLRTNERRRNFMEGIRPWFIPAILGMTRQERMSLHDKLSGMRSSHQTRRLGIACGASI